ncbi:imidazole glycerol phosphate synthase subunit HisH [Janthinobacterium fluminis]|uniref:Imidazole glycerol phosphate synthase subunit HisH n=1 Tax=Janthinobacterium fluminis TaxID=2987524 RepID=A0ABT5K1K6_9BURK|nr:imidazole glycerol phosphate synthase subunit HisH [Janthinobacterium fluminis]MDC8758872.1 imidazole glycerol phosphate synthase subunit HisH [Janthinobacterium fluminis]
MIKIVDYGLGNISAFSNMYKRMNIPAAAAKTAAELDGASKIILPGVGAFDHAMDLLDASGMRATLEALVCDARVPVLGICVGMQILADGSDEGKRPGLGWVPGRVRAFKDAPAAAQLPTPHMGWNDVAPAAPHALFAGLETEARFYFLHSYFFACAQAGGVMATSTYGVDFACAVHRDNVYGVQFHPEKSHHHGARLLKNFAEL